MIKSNYSYDLIMGCKFVEEGGVWTERVPTGRWMEFIPMDIKEKSHYIRISKIKETNTVIDFIDDQC